MDNTTFEASFKPRKRKFIPKKILKHTQVQLNEKYSFKASIWVADTPESNYKPTINLTMQHNGDKLRLCFQSTAELILAIEELRHFVGDGATALHLSHTEAVEEFLNYHEADRLPPIDEYTVYTVIQEKKRKGKTQKAFVCDKSTGDIIETIKVEDRSKEDEKGNEAQQENQHFRREVISENCRNIDATE